MDNIIRSILDIDRNAAQRLEDAQKKKLRIINDAKALEEKLVQDAVENAKTELERLEKEELKKTEEKIAALDEMKNSKISAMEESFEKNSQEWCEEIFKAVISI